MPTHLVRSSLTAAGPYLIRLASLLSGVYFICHSPSPVANYLLSVPSSNSLLAFPSYFRSCRDLESKPFVWFRTKTDKGIVCLADPLHSVTLSCLKVTQCQRARSEMRRCVTHALFRSKLWQQDHCQHPENANLDGSTIEGTAQRIGRLFGDGGTEGHCQEDPDQGVHRKSPGNHWWNSPAAYSVDCQRFRRLTHNYECMWRRSWRVGPTGSRQARSLLRRQKNLRLIKSARPPSYPDLNLLDYFVRPYVENITNMTSHHTKASLIAAIRRVFAELLPALVEKACSQFRIRIEAVIEAEGGYIE